MTKFIYNSAINLAKMIRNGEASSVDIVSEHLDRIKKFNENLHAVILLTEEDALKTAEACDREVKEGKFRGPLHGVPITIKEQFWLKGQRSTMNFKMFKDWIAPQDAVLVERVKQAGAIIMGKTNVPRNLLDYQVSGDIYPEGKNPYNQDYTPGGSSGGSAAALASGMTPIEIGADFGGSIRVPANFCGLYGLKPTERTVPLHGNVPLPKGARGFVFHMAQAGPMARTVEDTELLWKIIKGPHESDRSTPRIDWYEPSGKKIGDYRIAWVDGWPGYETSAEVSSSIQGLIERIKQEGTTMEKTGPDGQLHKRSLSLYVRLFPQMIAQDVPWFIRPLMKKQIRNSLLKGLKRYTKEYKQGFDLSFGNYSETMGTRATVVEAWEKFFQNFDFLICPVAFGPAFKRCKLGSRISFENKELIYINYVWPYVGCFNASGHPAMNIPIGLGKDGLPLGIQIVGPYWNEPEMFHFAKQVASLTPGFIKPEGY